MSSDLRLGLKPYSPPCSNPSSKDEFHPTASGTEPISLSPSIENKIRAAKANIRKRLDLGLTFPTDGGSQVGIIPLGTGGSLPNKYRNGECLGRNCGLIDLNWTSFVYVDYDTEVGKYIVRFRRRHLGSNGTNFWVKCRLWCSAGLARPKVHFYQSCTWGPSHWTCPSTCEEEVCELYWKHGGPLN